MRVSSSICAVGPALQDIRTKDDLSGCFIGGRTDMGPAEAAKLKAKFERQSHFSKLGGTPVNILRSAQYISEALSYPLLQKKWVGMIGKEHLDPAFDPINVLKNLGIECEVYTDPERETGIVFCYDAVVIRPDGSQTIERTMRVPPGSHYYQLEQHLKTETFEEGQAVYACGYELNNGRLIETVASNCQGAGAKFWFNVGAVETVITHRERIWDLIKQGKIHALMLNLNELRALMGNLDFDKEGKVVEVQRDQPFSVEASCKTLNAFVPITVVTNEEQGCYLYHKELGLIHEPSLPVATHEQVDATGAGDYYDGALMAALIILNHLEETCKLSLENRTRIAMRMAHRVASDILRSEGAEIRPDLRDALINDLKGLVSTFQYRE